MTVVGKGTGLPESVQADLSPPRVCTHMVRAPGEVGPGGSQNRRGPTDLILLLIHIRLPCDD